MNIHEIFIILFASAAWLILTRRHSLKFVADSWRELFPVLAGVVILHFVTLPWEFLYLPLAIVIIWLLSCCLKLHPYSVIYLYSLVQIHDLLPRDGFSMTALLLSFVGLLGISGLLLLLYAGFEERYRYQVVPRAMTGLPFRLLMSGVLWVLLVYIVSMLSG